MPRRPALLKEVSGKHFAGKASDYWETRSLGTRTLLFSSPRMDGFYKLNADASSGPPMSRYRGGGMGKKRQPPLWKCRQAGRPGEVRTRKQPKRQGRRGGDACAWWWWGDHLHTLPVVERKYR